MGKRKKQVRRRQRPGNNGSIRSFAASALPKQLNLVPIVKRTARYCSNASISQGTITNITINELITTGGVMATGTTTFYPVFNAVKVHWLKVWAYGSSTPNTISLRWGYTSLSNIGALGPNKIISDTSMSTAAPAFLKAVPPRGSVLGNWCNLDQNGNNSVMQLLTDISSGSQRVVIDLCATWTMWDSSQTPSATTTIASMIVGDIYFPPLDGISSNTLQIIELPTIH